MKTKHAKQSGCISQWKQKTFSNGIYYHKMRGQMLNTSRLVEPLYTKINEGVKLLRICFIVKKLSHLLVQIQTMLVWTKARPGFMVAIAGNNTAFLCGRMTQRAQIGCLLKGNLIYQYNDFFLASCRVQTWQFIHEIGMIYYKESSLDVHLIGNNNGDRHLWVSSLNCSQMKLSVKLRLLSF